MLQRRSTPQPASQFGKKAFMTNCSGRRFLQSTLLTLSALPMVGVATFRRSMTKQMSYSCLQLRKTRRSTWETRGLRKDSSTWKRFLWTEWDAHCLEHKHQQTMRRAHQHRRYTRSSSNRRLLLLLLLLLLWGEDGLALRHHRSFSATSHLWFINASEGSMRLIYK